MTDNRLLDLVDDRDFRTLFVEELGWNNPDRPDLTVEVDDETFTLQQVAGYKGLRIWHCPVLPPRKIQRQIDVLVGQDNQERLVIFTNEQRQEWRWPRRAQLGSANAKLLVHEHIVGDRSTHLTQRLQAIELDFDEDLSLVALLDRMRDAFDHEAESASVAAARLMGTLYTELAGTGVDDHESTLLLARLLFLMFGDDADMWKPEGLFEKYLRDHTTAETLHTDLRDLFEVLNTPEKGRTLPDSSPYAQFRYVNGGLFSVPLHLPPLSSDFRNALIEACEFDWSIISPAVFGSMFQTVKSKEARRHGGEHYTTEENILKTIRPLFLDEYRERLERAWDDKAKLTRLHNDIGRLRFLDPACGCGNFLIVSYRELRALELDLLKRRRDLDMTSASTKKVERAQLSLDVTGDIKVTLDHFYGIELEEWPARIAETAMLLVDHLANQRMAQEFGMAPDRLPITIAPNIIQGNALRMNWEDFLQPSEHVYVFGNPPFVGQKEKTPAQREDLLLVWGENHHGYMDYVTGWYAKTSQFFEGHNSKWAFVSTSSICQGVPVHSTWSPLLEQGWHIDFAHQPFVWTSESTGKAGVHVVIVGLSRDQKKERRLFQYATSGKGRPTEKKVSRISPYLADLPDILAAQRTKPLSPMIRSVTVGNGLTDGSAFIVENEDLEEFKSDIVAAKYLRPFLATKDLLAGTGKNVLLLRDMNPEDYNRSPLLRERIDRVREFRQNSTKPATRKLASRPHVFGEPRYMTGGYLAIPKVTGEARDYLPVLYLNSDVVCNNTVYTVADESGLLFGLISSSAFTLWLKLVGGHTRADLNFSSTLVWNTFPVPMLHNDKVSTIEQAARNLMEVRTTYSNVSLESIYHPKRMPVDLKSAHVALDAVVDEIFEFPHSSTPTEKQEAMLKKYEKMVNS